MLAQQHVHAVHGPHGLWNARLTPWVQAQDVNTQSLPEHAATPSATAMLAVGSWRHRARRRLHAALLLAMRRWWHVPLAPAVLGAAHVRLDT